LTERLRYTGEQSVSFTTGYVGHVEPGGEFDVPTELAGRFTRRADVEYADGRPAPAASPAEPGGHAAPVEAAPPAPAAEPVLAPAPVAVPAS
jgi:hypothetical protein